LVSGVFGRAIFGQLRSGWQPEHPKTKNCLPKIPKIRSSIHVARNQKLQLPKIIFGQPDLAGSQSTKKTKTLYQKPKTTNQKTKTPYQKPKTIGLDFHDVCPMCVWCD
jgi:hypothetical protein